MMFFAKKFRRKLGCLYLFKQNLGFKEIINNWEEKILTEHLIFKYSHKNHKTRN